METIKGSMEVNPTQLLTNLAAEEFFISITSVRYVTRFEATPLNANLSIPDITATFPNLNYYFSRGREGCVCVCGRLLMRRIQGLLSPPPPPTIDV